MKIIAYGYIPSFNLFVCKEIVEDNFYIDKNGFFECEIIGDKISGDFFSKLQNCNSLKNVPRELEELEFFVTHIKCVEDFNFKKPTLVKSYKKVGDYKIGDFIIPNGGNPGKIIEINLKNELVALKGDTGLNWHSVYEILEKDPSIYAQSNF